MGHEIIRQKSPEEEELEAKQKVLSGLEEEMASLQLELSTLESELQVFNGTYLNRFGKKFLLLDELKSKISTAIVRLHPENQEKIHRTLRVFDGFCFVLGFVVFGLGVNLRVNAFVNA